jgi:hypothetical protein
MVTNSHNMKNLFIINEEEKNRILNLHETATKRHYLSEQVIKGMPGDPYEYKLENGVYSFRNVKKGETQWTTANANQSSIIKTKIFKDSKTKNIINKGSKIDLKNKEFFTQTKDTTGDTMRSFNQRNNKMIETAKKSIELMGKISDKTYKQLVSMMTKGTLKKDTFIVVNKDNAIASLFGPNYKFIGKSSITSGQIKDTKSFNIDDKTYENWFNRSLEFFKKNPSHKDSVKIKNWLNTVKKNTNIIKNDGSINYEDYIRENKNKKIGKFPFSYESTKQAGLNVTPGGVFSLGSGFTEKTFEAGDTTNVFPLVDVKTGKRIAPAIHGFAGSKKGQDIKKFDSQDVNKNKDESRSGYGCVNVDGNFIKLINKYNPKYVIIIPDYSQTIDVKIVTFETWSEKIASLGDKCVRSFISLFS